MAVAAVGPWDVSGEFGPLADARVFQDLAVSARYVVTGGRAPHAKGKGRDGEDPPFEAVPPATLQACLADAFSRGPVCAKVGFLGCAAVVDTVVGAMREHPPRSIVLTWCPQPGSAHEEEAERTAAALVPRATVAIVRASDLARWLGAPPDGPAALRSAAESVRAAGARAALITGWMDGGRVVDVLDDGGRVVLSDAPRVEARRIPGLVEAFPAALAARLDAGDTLRDAMLAAQRYVGTRLRRGA